MGQMDINDLRCDEVNWEDGYIERERSKTAVKAKCKLWPVTLALLEKHRHKGSKGSDRVFLTTIRQRKFKTGEEARYEPLVRQELRDGRLTKSNAITNAFWRLLRKKGIDGGRGFCCLRKTGASLIEVIDPLATAMYLSHSERGMKRNYAQRDWARLERALEATWELLKDVLRA